MSARRHLVAGATKHRDRWHGQDRRVTHPAAMVFDDAAPLPDGRPGFFAPYFSREPVVMDETHDYIDETIRAANATTCTWLHPLSDVISALLKAGMVLNWLHEHDRGDLAHV